jgi:hypothetical protein
MQIEVIKQGALIDIKIGSPFAKRLKDLLIYMVSNQDSKIVREINLKISRKEALNEWGEHYFTVLALVNDLEENAREQGQTQMVDLPNDQAHS